MISNKMEAQHISDAFMAILGSNNEARAQAEVYLNSIVNTPGLFEALIKITNMHELFEIRQSAVIFLKNQVKNWKNANIPAADKELLKGNILECIIHNFSHEKIRVQYEEIVKQIAFNDFPNDWQGIADKLNVSLNENNYFQIMGAITVIY